MDSQYILVVSAFWKEVFDDPLREMCQSVKIFILCEV